MATCAQVDLQQAPDLSHSALLRAYGILWEAHRVLQINSSETEARKTKQIAQLRKQYMQAKRAAKPPTPPLPPSIWQKVLPFANLVVVVIFFIVTAIWMMPLFTPSTNAPTSTIHAVPVESRSESTSLSTFDIAQRQEIIDIVDSRLRSIFSLAVSHDETDL